MLRHDHDPRASGAHSPTRRPVALAVRRRGRETLGGPADPPSVEPRPSRVSARRFDGPTWARRSRGPGYPALGGASPKSRSKSAETCHEPPRASVAECFAPPQRKTTDCALLCCTCLRPLVTVAEDARRAERTPSAGKSSRARRDHARRAASTPAPALAPHRSIKSARERRNQSPRRG